MIVTENLKELFDNTAKALNNAVTAPDIDTNTIEALARTLSMVARIIIDTEVYTMNNRKAYETGESIKRALDAIY